MGTPIKLYHRNAGGTLYRRGAPIVNPPIPPTTYPEPALPAGVATIDYADLAQAGDTFRTALQRLTTPKIVILPAGLFRIFDLVSPIALGSSTTVTYGVYAPNVIGLVGAGVDQTVIQLEPGSFTQYNKIPTQTQGGTNPYNIMRLSTGLRIVKNLTIAGTDQPNDPNTGLPATYNGFVHYQSTGTITWGWKISGCPGNWNAPPGETFELNHFSDTNTVDTVEVDGYTWTYTNVFLPDGTLTRTKGSHYGGSASGHNGSHNITDNGSYYHDGWVSGLTYSFHGVPTDPSATTQGVTTNHMIISRNANWDFSAGGRRFSGINHENVYGAVRHNYVDITMTDLACTQWDCAHMSFDSRLGDNADIIILEPTWHNGYARYNGCFTLRTGVNYNSVPNTQTTAPTVIKNGVTLIPIRITGNPSGNLTYDPARYYMWTTG